MTQVTIALGEAGQIAVDLDKINAHEAVKTYIFNYGLKQMLNDVHASVTKKTETDDDKRADQKRALVEKKLASLYAGEVAQQRAMSGLSPVERKMRELAEADIIKVIRANGKKVADFKDAMADMVAKQVEAKADKYRAAAEVILAVKVELDEEIDLGALMPIEAEGNEPTE
jgi:hypothetical protein